MEIPWIMLLMGGLIIKEFARLHGRPTHAIAQWLLNLFLAGLTGFIAYVLVLQAMLLLPR